MLDIVIMEPQQLVSYALKKIFEDKLRVNEVLDNIDALRKSLTNGDASLVVMELYSSQDTLFDGIEFVEGFHRTWPDIKLLIVTDLEQPSLLLKILKCRGVSLISKQDKLQILEETIDALVAGQPCSSPCLQALINNPPTRAQYALTDMEWRVLRLMGQGASVNEISQMININYKTVQGHKRNFMKKMDISSNIQLIRMLRKYSNTDFQYADF